MPEYAIDGQKITNEQKVENKINAPGSKEQDCYSLETWRTGFAHAA
jgi:hypothetical protein